MAVADKELIGKTLKDKNIELEVREKFYNGEEISKEELKTLLREYGNINLVGNKAVGVAIEEKLASEKQVMKIDGIKHVQIMMV